MISTSPEFILYNGAAAFVVENAKTVPVNVHLKQMHVTFKMQVYLATELLLPPSLRQPIFHTLNEFHLLLNAKQSAVRNSTYSAVSPKCVSSPKWNGEIQRVLALGTENYEK